MWVSFAFCVRYRWLSAYHSKFLLGVCIYLLHCIFLFLYRCQSFLQANMLCNYIRTHGTCVTVTITKNFWDIISWRCPRGRHYDYNSRREWDCIAEHKYFCLEFVYIEWSIYKWLEYYGNLTAPSPRWNWWYVRHVCRIWRWAYHLCFIAMTRKNVENYAK